jgi:hypothetical protein
MITRPIKFDNIVLKIDGQLFELSDSVNFSELTVGDNIVFLEDEISVYRQIENEDELRQLGFMPPEVYRVLKLVKLEDYKND